MPNVRSLLNRWLPVLLWMALIFSASSDAASFQHSSRIIAPLLHWLFPHTSDETVHAAVVLVRKGCHLGEYAVLALLLWRALRPGAASAPAPWSWTQAGWTILLVALYAASDELHQYFVPSREASVIDVMIDTMGGIAGLLLLWATGCLARKRPVRAE